MLTDLWFIEHANWWLLVDGLIVGMLLPKIILQRRETGTTLAWVVVIVLLPYLGLLLFWLLGPVRLKLRRRKRRRIEQALEPSLHSLLQGRAPAPEAHGRIAELMRLSLRLGADPPVGGNQIECFRDGQATFAAIAQEIGSACDHIHLLFYIWKPDYTGIWIRDLLVAACSRGVEVRVLIDDVGSYTTRRAFFQPLIAAGGKVDWFFKVNPLSRQLNLNYRNHRKIIVIDGQSGFIGGMNIGDEYAGVGEPWKDLHCYVRGPVVNSLQEVFSQDWYHTTSEDLISPRYFPNVEPPGEVVAQLLPSGPAEERWRAIPTFVFTAINEARERVWIETPYFIPDQATLLALQAAALRGVDTRLLMPGKSDHRLVQAAANYFVDELIEAGVKVYQDFTAMRHGKAVIVDDWFVTVGSANMDLRSFRLNFEANLVVYDSGVNRCMADGFVRQLEEGELVTTETRRRLSKWQRLFEGLARLLSPLL